jgi:hypothetical protein
MARAFFPDGFFEALGGKHKATRGASGSADAAALWGTEPTPAFTRFFDYLGLQGAGDEPSLGELMPFASSDWRVGRENAFDFMMPEFFRRAALLSGTLAIGTTGAGDIWLIDPAPQRSMNRVFLLDHEVGTIHVIADSIESLALLSQLIEQDETSAKAWKPLAGRVRGYNDIEVPRGIALLGDRADVIERFSAAKNLYGALWFGRTPDPISKPTDAHAAALIAHALSTYLLGEDALLEDALARAKNHPSRFLQDMATSLRAKMKKTKRRDARLELLGSAA